jgi:hypothetical protein
MKRKVVVAIECRYTRDAVVITPMHRTDRGTRYLGAASQVIVPIKGVENRAGAFEQAIGSILNVTGL